MCNNLLKTRLNFINKLIKEPPLLYAFSSDYALLNVWQWASDFMRRIRQVLLTGKCNFFLPVVSESDLDRWISQFFIMLSNFLRHSLFNRSLAFNYRIHFGFVKTHLLKIIQALLRACLNRPFRGFFNLIFIIIEQTYVTFQSWYQLLRLHHPYITLISEPLLLSFTLLFIFHELLF